MRSIGRAAQDLQGEEALFAVIKVCIVEVSNSFQVMR